jgi:hypothetical protein
VEQVLEWEARHVAGAPGGPPIPDEELFVALPEHNTTLKPTWAVAELGECEQRCQLLVRVEAGGVDPDKRGALDGWEATPHQRFERLLRDTGVYAGLLVTDNALRLIYAPRGETSGHLTFPIRPLGTVAGRPMLGGLKLLLDRSSLFTAADTHRLPALLKESREAQSSVSTALAEQVLGAAHELLRGLDSANPVLIRELAQSHPDHLYEGLVTVLMRLVFILYCEDRDLLPSRTDGRAREIYETSYSVRGLYATLVEDAALNPDTMDERRGGWGRLLALFRLIHKGHATHFVQARGGKLFDPDEFPFLEGRAAKDEPPRILNVSDGCLLRIVEGLMTLKVRGAERERLSYRALDVEQIGSVYETVMGFTVEAASGRVLAIKAGKNNRTPVFVALNELLAKKGKDRIKDLKENAGRGQLSAAQAKAIEAAASVDELAAALDSIVDERGSPLHAIAPAGSPILQPTDERRRTGSHYTPRSLTAPIVKHALEPAFERLGPDATPDQVLDLKVCDPAMGSGAFLVEACRAIGERLEKAWGRWPDTRPKIPADEDEALHARRLVAQRCIYGVDKNPRAVDLARLSLWLATLAKDHEFTFLDHALKCGDSLVGLTMIQIAAAHWDESEQGLPLFRKLVKETVGEAMTARDEIRSAPDDIARSIQETRHRIIEDRLTPVRTIGDAVISAFFAADKPKAREKERAKIESWLAGGSLQDHWEKLKDAASSLRAGEHPLPPFHWEVEFPEVFGRENGGFDAIVGNPPFLGGSIFSGQGGAKLLRWLLTKFDFAHGKSDLVSFFFRLAFAHLRQDGCFGLLATKSVRQGVSRETGLQFIVEQAGTIYRAIRRLRWPGEAAVVVSVVHVKKGQVPSGVLDEQPVDHITSFLLPFGPNRRPPTLTANAGVVFSGINPNGEGFVLSRKEAEEILSVSLDDAAHIFPYLSSVDLNGDPRAAATRYIIDVGSLSEADLQQHPQLYDRLFHSVRAERAKSSERRLREEWWRFSRPASKLSSRLGQFREILVMGRLATHHTFAFQPSNIKFSDALSVFLSGSRAFFAVVQSCSHELWAKFIGSAFKDDPRYIPEDCFETFPFPDGFENSSTLEVAGRAYHDHRAALMMARSEGMTKIYNRFHDWSEAAADIVYLRQLHAAMDRAVLEAFGWRDLAARATPIYLDESNEDDHTYQGRLFWPSDFRDEVLARLLALNAERAAAEKAAGLTAIPGEEKDQEDLEEAAVA